MADSSGEQKLSLRPWPKADNRAALPTLLQRINVERGNFRTITEDQLRVEIEKNVEAPKKTVEDDDEGESEEEEEEEKKPDRVKEVLETKAELVLLLE